MAKLKKMVESYGEKDLTSIDRRLIRGLYIKHMKDHDEEIRLKSMNRSLSSRFFIENNLNRESFIPK